MRWGGRLPAFDQRPAAAALVALGLALGAVGDRLPAHVPRAADGYVVLRGDFHVHSCPGDGALAPWDIAHEAARRGLDVFALTNHNAMLSWRLARALGWTDATPGVLMIPGDEVTSVGVHLAAVGVAAPVPWRLPIPDIVALVHAQGGVAIAAHPGDERYRDAFDDRALRALDGIEAAHPQMYESERLRGAFAEVYGKALATHPSIAAIGSSDFHTWAPLGWGRTYLFVRQVTIGGVLDAIRTGRTVACDGMGFTYGPAALRASVDADCRADTSARPDGDAWSRGGAIASWMGLLGLVVFGRD